MWDDLRDLVSFMVLFAIARRLEKAREIDRHVRVKVRRSVGERRMEVEFIPLREVGEGTSAELMNQLIQSLAQQLASFFSIQGELEDVG